MTCQRWYQRLENSRKLWYRTVLSISNATGFKALPVDEPAFGGAALAPGLTIIVDTDGIACIGYDRFVRVTSNFEDLYSSSHISSMSGKDPISQPQLAMVEVS